MNVRDAMRSADPARSLPAISLSDADELLMREIVDAPPRLSDQSRPSSATPPRPRRDRKPLIATALVAIAVVAGTILAIRAVPTAAPAPARSPSATPSVSSSLVAAVNAKLASAADGKRLDPELPSQTWTNADRGAQGNAIDLTGKTFYLAAACTGGGALTIQIAGQLDTTIDCTTSTTVIGPINLTAVAAKAKRALGIDIAASSGRPTYFAKGVTLEGTDVTTTSSVDVNGRTLLVYPASGAGGNQALLEGALTQNAAGCIAVGNQVLVVPSNIELRPDGSLTIGNTTHAPGSTVRLGGGVAASIPVGSPCRAATGDYFLVGDYPQSQSG